MELYLSNEVYMSSNLPCPSGCDSWLRSDIDCSSVPIPSYSLTLDCCPKHGPHTTHRRYIQPSTGDIANTSAKAALSAKEEDGHLLGTIHQECFLYKPCRNERYLAKCLVVPLKQIRAVLEESKALHFDGVCTR